MLTAAEAAPARVLPTAEELAPYFYREDELKHLKGIATSLGDTEAAELFDATIKARRRLDIQAAIDRPKVYAQAVTQQVGAFRDPGAGQLLGLGLARGAGQDVSSAQSAGPSE